MLNIFDSDAFSIARLTDAINSLDFVPGRLGQLGIFQAEPVDVEVVAIEEKGGVLELIPPSARGGPGTTIDKEKSVIRDLRVPKFEINDSVMASEVAGIRTFGSETELQTVQQKVATRLGNHVDSFAATEEYARVGAIKGLITYANGTTLDLYNAFEVSQITAINWDLDNGSAVDGSLREKCDGVIRTMADELGNTPFSGLRAMVGNDFWDALIKHPEIRGTYLASIEAAELRNASLDIPGAIYGSFRFGKITWENYRGSVNGTDFIGATKAHIYPEGVNSLFKNFQSPADYLDTVNTMGLPRYARQYEMSNGKGVHLDSQMCPLNICTRPRVLLEGDLT